MDDKGSMVRGRVFLPEGQYIVKTSVFRDFMNSNDYLLAIMKKGNSVFLGKFNMIGGPEIHFDLASEEAKLSNFSFSYKLEIEYFGGDIEQVEFNVSR